EIRVVLTQYVDLLGRNAAGFQFLFDLFQLAEVVTDVIEPVHGFLRLPIPLPQAGRAARTAPARIGPAYCLTLSRTDLSSAGRRQSDGHCGMRTATDDEAKM